MSKPIMVIGIILIIIICCMFVILSFDLFGFKSLVVKETGWFFPRAHKIDSIIDAEELGRIKFPDGASIQDFTTKKMKVNFTQN